MSGDFSACVAIATDSDTNSNMERAHVIILREFLNRLKDKPIHNILDAGSGKTSLSALIECFPESEIDAVVYPGDTRKINSINENIHGNYHLIECDLCEQTITKSYDLVLAHMLLGEAAKFGNPFSLLLERLMNIPAKYIIIIDYLQDPTVDCAMIESYIKAHSICQIEKLTAENSDPQKFSDFIGKTNFGYLIGKQL